jgi:hypothetical protein
MGIKKITDEKVLNNTRLLQNEGYFTNMLMTMVIESLKKLKLTLTSIQQNL